MTPSSTVAGPTGGQRVARSLRRGFLFFFLALILLAVAGGYLLMHLSYSSGYRVGTIQKMSKKGLIFKTYEGELAQGFLDSDSSAAGGVATRMFEFSVPAGDTEVIHEIDHAIEDSKRVKLYYEERYRALPWVGETRYVVTKVEEIGGAPAAQSPTVSGSAPAAPAPVATGR